MRRLRLVLILLIGALPTGPLRSSGDPLRPALEAVLRLDRTEATVGDRMAATLIVRHRPGIRLEPVEIGRRLGPFVVDETGETEVTTSGEDGSETRFRFSLAVFRTGTHSVPPLRIRGIDTGTGEVAEAETPPVEVVVRSVLEDEGTDLAGIRGPFELPGGGFPWFRVLAGFAAVAAILLWWMMRRGRRLISVAAAAPEPEIPPEEWALRRLQALTTSDLLARGEVRRFFIEFSAILKEFLHRRFGIVTLERTTDELVRSLRFARLPDEVIQGTRDLLAGSDLVKFARFRPVEATIRSLVDRARRLIEATRRPPADRSLPAAGAGP